MIKLKNHEKALSTATPRTISSGYRWIRFNYNSMIKKVIPKWMFNRLKEKFDISSLEDVHKLTDEQLLSVPMFGKMRLQRLRGLSQQNQTIDMYSYNKGVHDAVVGICRLITDNYKKCITPRECEILLHEDDLKMKPVLKSLEKLVAHHDPDGNTFLMEDIEEAEAIIKKAKSHEQLPSRSS